MAEYQRRVVYLSNAAKNELFANGTVTVGNVTITYSDSDMYVTPTSEWIGNLPSPPATPGTYVLTATVTASGTTFSWASA